MPTYVYECSNCNDVFEVEQRITENPIDECRCGAKGTVKRLIQPVGVMFKGAGFHINDYASSSAPAKPPEPAENCTGNPSSCACSTPQDSDS
ncbi:MAG TPA: FmdB family zinc ribbon protein [Fimbriimonadaceae bacterium]|nr:FmdB family zinc ribbon protein [Fimbriimonadaceae bacterium]